MSDRAPGFDRRDFLKSMGLGAAFTVGAGAAGGSLGRLLLAPASAATTWLGLAATDTSGTPSLSGDGRSKPCQWIVCESVRSGRWISPRLLSVICTSSFLRNPRCGAVIWACPLYVAISELIVASGDTGMNPKMYSGSASRPGTVA